MSACIPVQHVHRVLEELAVPAQFGEDLSGLDGIHDLAFVAAVRLVPMSARGAEDRCPEVAERTLYELSVGLGRRAHGVVTRGVRSYLSAQALHLELDPAQAPVNAVDEEFPVLRPCGGRDRVEQRPECLGATDQEVGVHDESTEDEIRQQADRALVGEVGDPGNVAEALPDDVGARGDRGGLFVNTRPGERGDVETPVGLERTVGRVVKHALEQGVHPLRVL